MAKNKISLAPIANKSNRRSTFKKRKQNLIKKTSELATLCDIQACIIISGPDNPDPDVWPPREATMQILSRFNSLPEEERTKHMLDPMSTTSKKLQKLRDELRQVGDENQRFESLILLHELRNGRVGVAGAVSAGAVSMLSEKVEVRLNELRERMNKPRSVGPAQGMLLEAALPWLSADMAQALQGQYSLGLTGADMAPPVHGQYFFGVAGADMAPSVHEQYMFGVGGADMAQWQQELWYPVVSSRDLGFGAVSADMAPSVHEQYIFGAGGADVAQSEHEQYMFGVGGADVAQWQQEMWYPVASSRDLGFGAVSADMAPAQWEPEVENEKCEFLDWFDEELLDSISQADAFWAD